MSSDKKSVRENIDQELNSAERELQELLNQARELAKNFINQSNSDV